jgi:hypothetical protein
MACTCAALDGNKEQVQRSADYNDFMAIGHVENVREVKFTDAYPYSFEADLLVERSFGRPVPRKLGIVGSTLCGDVDSFLSGSRQFVSLSRRPSGELRAELCGSFAMSGVERPANRFDDGNGNVRFLAALERLIPVYRVPYQPVMLAQSNDARPTQTWIDGGYAVASLAVIGALVTLSRRRAA